MAVTKIEIENRKDLAKNNVMQEIVLSELKYRSRIMVLIQEIKLFLKTNPNQPLEVLLKEIKLFKLNANLFLKNVDDATLKINGNLLLENINEADLRANVDFYLKIIDEAIQIGVPPEKREALRAERVALFMEFFETYDRYFPLYNKFLKILEKYPGTYEPLNTTLLNDHKFNLQNALADPCQRGPRYLLLIKAALENPSHFETANLQEFQQLKELLEQQLAKVNEAQRAREAAAQQYHFGDLFFKPIIDKISKAVNGPTL